MNETPDGKSLTFLRPIDIQRQARVPYRTVVRWLETGHPAAGVLPSVNFAGAGGRKSYRVRPEDWERFLDRLRTQPRTPAVVPPKPRPSPKSGGGPFRY